MPLANGQAVREAINQGFARAEMASLADKAATKVYAGASASGPVVKNKVTSAIQNYRAAVNLFMRALPSLPNDGSAELVRQEIRRLLARLGELQQILRQVDPNATPEDLGLDGENEDDEALRRRLEADVRAMQPKKFKPGDEVDVEQPDGSWRPAHVVSVGQDQNAYTVAYDDDGSEEADVEEDRIRFAVRGDGDGDGDGDDGGNGDGDHHAGGEDEAAAAQEEEERRLIVSEIVESERLYRNALRDLTKFYLAQMSNPLRWGGERSTSETLFTQRIMTQSEIRTIFANIEEIAGISEIFFDALEQRFTEWTADQKLGDVFLLHAPFFLCYAEYADVFTEAEATLAKIRSERDAFEAVLGNAKAKGIAPLDVLMRKPVNRISEYKSLLGKLVRRTRPSHPDFATIQQAYVAMGNVEEKINAALQRKENQRQVALVEKMFDPPLALVTPTRLLVRFSPKMNRIDPGARTPVMRAAWLFNDVVLCGRPSKWMAVGFYRHDGQFRVTSARDAPEFGPLAFEVAGDAPADKWVFIPPTEEEKRAWMHDLRGWCKVPSAGGGRRGGVGAGVGAGAASGAGAAGGKALLGPATRQVLQRKASSSSAPSPKAGEMTTTTTTTTPSQPTTEKDDYWRELRDVETGQSFFYNEASGQTTWDRPTMRRATGLYDFDATGPDEMSFKKGDVLLVEWVESEYGWARAKVPGTSRKGLVPKNRVKMLV